MREAGVFVFQLSQKLLESNDSFVMARTFAAHVLKHARLNSAQLIWPDVTKVEEPSSVQTPLRQETLGSPLSAKSKKVWSARFLDQGDLFFRIDFFSRQSRKLNPALLRELRQGLKLVSKAIEANENRLKAEELSRFQSIRHLSAGLSHELNTPLTTLLYNAKKISREAGLQMGSEEIKAAAQTITNVMANYRLTSGDGEFVELSPVRTVDLGKRIQQAAEAKFPNMRHALRFEFEPSRHEVSVQIDDIEKLVLAIVTNAVEAVLGAEHPRIEVKMRVRETKLQVLITDNGAGIPLENRPFIFAPFFSTKDVGQGSGLGLSIARAIAFLNNGTLRLNPLSQHTQFILELPLRSEAVRRSAA